MLSSEVFCCYNRCCGGKDEEDFRPLFENFVQDLLSTLNLPEWPSSEVLLTLLGMLLVPPTFVLLVCPSLNRLKHLQTFVIILHFKGKHLTPTFLIHVCLLIFVLEYAR